MLILLALLATPVAVDLELAGGAAHTLEAAGSYSSYPFVPALQARAAVDFNDRLSFDARYVAILGGEAPALYDSNTGAFKAVAGLAVVRFHSSTAPQYWAEGGLGVGHLISLQQGPSNESPPLRGRAGLAAMLGTGIRFAPGRWLLGAELSWLHWTQAEYAAATCCNGPARFGLSTSALVLMLSVGYSLFR